jgi:heptosyltransferase-2
VADSDKILVVGPSWVGDMVMAQSLYITLKKQRPDCIIDVLAPAWSSPIIARMPQVRRSIDMPVGHGQFQLGERYRLGKQLQREQYDQAILLPNSLKSALIPFFASIPKRTGWRGEMRFGLLNDIRLLDKNRYPLMIERFVALAYEANSPLPKTLPWPALQNNPNELERLREKFQLGDRFIALCPGAEFGPAKRWPDQHYAQLARHYIDQGWQVALFGSEKDRKVTGLIQQSFSEKQQQACIDLAGNTSLSEAVDLLSAASAVVSNDSGLMHIAASLARPMVVVYGSTSPTFTPPLSDKVSVMQLDVDCGPCFKRECPLSHLKCLQDLSPQQVIAALDELIAGSAVKVMS